MAGLPPELPTAQVRAHPGGLRSLALPMPGRASCVVGVWVRSGSAHEARHESGLTHLAEHMLFKGTPGRDARAINRDAERLGAEVNAHTDKDHLALLMHGLAADAPAFVEQLADQVLAPTFPDDELERERQVLLHEFTEVEDDPMATAFRLFDHACWGLHPLARPVIGERRLVERFTRAQLEALVRERFTAPNIVVAASGGFDVARFEAAVARCFAAAPAGTPNRLEAPAWHGGVRARDLSGSVQTHLVLGFPLPGLAGDDEGLATLAAAVFGEGMGSPLMDELRERRALLYYAACAADQFEPGGQFVIEASTAPEQAGEAAAEVLRLLRAQAERVDDDDFERGRAQLIVRRLRNAEDPARLVEDAALELLARGEVTAPQARIARLREAGPATLRRHFASMLAAPVAIGLTGRVPRGLAASLRAPG